MNAEKKPITSMFLYIVNTAQSCKTMKAIFVDSARISVRNVLVADFGLPRDAINPYAMPAITFTPPPMNVERPACVPFQKLARIVKARVT